MLGHMYVMIEGVTCNLRESVYVIRKYDVLLTVSISVCNKLNCRYTNTVTTIYGLVIAV